MTVDTSSLSPIEERWLDYVVRLLNDAEHRKRCEESDGAQGTPALERSLRWPGYFGSAYEDAKHKILCVGQVHHASELYRTLGSLQPTLQNIAQLQQPYGAQAKKLIRVVQKSYEDAITEWGPWKKFRKVLQDHSVRKKYGNLGSDTIAYVNYARCWQTLDMNPDCRKPMKACGADYVLSDLANALEAQTVLIMSADTTLTFVGINPDRRRFKGSVHTFPGRPADADSATIASML